MRQFSFFFCSLITNKCVDDYDKHDEACHDEVVEVGVKREIMMLDFVTRMVTKIAEEVKQTNGFANGADWIFIQIDEFHYYLRKHSVKDYLD